MTRSIKKLLQVVHGREVGMAPRQHPLRTAHCPPLADVLAGRGGEHVATCVFCRKVCEMARQGAGPTIVLSKTLFEESFLIPHPETLLARTRVSRETTEGDVLGTWFPAGRLRTLELRTRNERLANQLVRCQLDPVSGGEPITEFLLLVPWRNGWIAGEISLETAVLYEKLGATGTLTVTTVTADELSADERSLLLERARQEPEPHVREGWRTWATAEARTAMGDLAEWLGQVASLAS
jgi:hypothetical protein